MKKRVLSIFLIIILAVTNLSVSYADGIDDLIDIRPGNYYGESWTPDGSNRTNVGTWVEEGENSTGIIRVIMNSLDHIFSYVWKAIGQLVVWILPTMDTIVFNNGSWGMLTQLTFFDANESGKLNHSMAGQVRATVSDFYQIFRYVAIIGFIVAIACISVKMIISSVGRQKQQYKEALKNWLMGLLLLVVGHWVMIYLIYFSDYLVELIEKITLASMDDIFNPATNWDIINGSLLTQVFMESLSSGSTTSLVSVVTGIALAATGVGIVWTVIGFIDPILRTIIIIIFVAMNLKVFKVYLERVVVVAVLIVLFPLVTVLYAFEKAGLRRGSSFSTWLNTFISQVYIQPIHALSIAIVCVMLTASTKIDIGGMPLLSIPLMGPVITIVILNFVFKIEEIVKRVFAVNGASLGQPVNVVKEIARLGKQGVNMGIGAHNLKRGYKGTQVFGEDGKLDKAKTRDARRAFLKDEALEAGMKWGERNGLNVRRIGLIEAKNTAAKMKLAIKNGKAAPEHIQEIISHMIHTKDFNERLNKFGIKDEKELANGLKHGHINAMLALMDANEAGSADKYMKKNKFGNVIPGEFIGGSYDSSVDYKKHPEVDPYEESEAKKLYMRSLVDSETRKHNILDMAINESLTDAGILDLKYNIMIENSDKAKRVKAVLGVKSLNDLTDEQWKAVAYCEANGKDIADVTYTVESNGHKEIYVDESKINAYKRDAANAEIIDVAINGIGDDTIRIRKALRARDMMDIKYIQKKIEECENNLTYDSFDEYLRDATIPEGAEEEAFKAQIQELCKKIAEDNANYRRKKKDENAGNGNPRQSVEPSSSGARTSRNIVGPRVVEVFDSVNPESQYYAAEKGVSIEDFATEIMKVKNDPNSWNLGNYHGFNFEISKYASAQELVDAYNKDSDGMLGRFMNGDFVDTPENIDRLVERVEKLDRSFILNKFRLVPDEFARQLKFGKDRETLLNRFKEEVRGRF